MLVKSLLLLAIVTGLFLGSHGKPAGDVVKSADQFGILGTRPVVRSPGVGSTNKTYIPFDDLKQLSNSILTVRSITLFAFYEVDSLQFTYTLKDGSIYRPPQRGEGFYGPLTIKLARDEYVAKIEGTIVFNNLISHVYITIKNPNNFKSTVYGPYGSYVGERNFVFEGYILGIHGKTGPSFSRQIVRNFGVYYLAPVEESEFFGIPNPAFYENPDMQFPPVVKISKMYISHGDKVDSLQVEYQALDGSTRLGDKHGGNGSNLTTVSLEYGEELIGLTVSTLEGPLQSPSVTQLMFISRKKDGSHKVYGPFGRSGDKTFSVPGRILGFMGTFSEIISSLKVFYS